MNKKLVSSDRYKNDSDRQMKRALSVIKNQNLSNYYKSQKIFKELNTTDGFLNKTKSKYKTLDSKQDDDDI